MSRFSFGKAVTGAALGLVLALAAPTGVSAQDAFSPDQESRIKEMIRDYIMQNPDVVLDALQEMERRRRAEAEARQQEVVSQMQDRLFTDPRSVAVGPADPESGRTVQMVEFFDYQCGYCKRVFPSLMQVLSDDPALRIVFIELPILGPVSTFAARAALASRKQDKYFELHQAIMNERGQLSELRVMEIADSIGIDVGKLQADMDDPEVARLINDNLALARDLGITGTPAMVVGKHLVPGAIGLEDLRNLIDETRAEQS